MATDRRRHRKDKMDALMNPKTAADWIAAALYPQSPYNQILTECIIARNELCEIIEEMLITKTEMNNRDAARREAMIQAAMDKEAAQKILSGRHELQHERKVPVSPQIQSIFELQAKADLLAAHVKILESMTPVKEAAVIAAKDKLHDIDKGWQARQAKEAASFVESLHDRLLKNKAGFSIEMKPSVAKRLEEAYKTASPAKILEVNPALAASAAANVEFMTNMCNFARELKVLSALNHILNDPDNKKPEADFFPTPSQIKAHAKLLKVDKHSPADVDAISAALSAKKELMSAQQEMREHLTEVLEAKKELNKMHNEILVMENAIGLGRGSPAA